MSDGRIVDVTAKYGVAIRHDLDIKLTSKEFTLEISDDLLVQWVSLRTDHTFDLVGLISHLFRGRLYVRGKYYCFNFVADFLSHCGHYIPLAVITPDSLYRYFEEAKHR